MALNSTSGTSGGNQYEDAGTQAEIAYRFNVSAGSSNISDKFEVPTDPPASNFVQLSEQTGNGTNCGEREVAYRLEYGSGSTNITGNQQAINWINCTNNQSYAQLKNGSKCAENEVAWRLENLSGSTSLKNN